MFPLIEIFPGAEVIASDLSLGLLRELRGWREDHYPDHDCLSLLQLDAADTVFADEQIDLLTGAHVLHHLADLRRAFGEFARILRPGALAVFWEPFESGSQIVSLIMQLLMAHDQSAPRGERIAPEILAGFGEFLFDLRRRRGSSKSQDQLDQIDDKGIFTPTQLRGLLDGSGLELEAIRQVYAARGFISTMVDHELRRRLHGLQALPSWARALVLDVEDQFSQELASEILSSAAIVLRKTTRA